MEISFWMLCTTYVYRKALLSNQKFKQILPRYKSTVLRYYDTKVNKLNKTVEFADFKDLFAGSKGILA